jgi:hypothetical protein
VAERRKVAEREAKKVEELVEMERILLEEYKEDEPRRIEQFMAEYFPEGYPQVVVSLDGYVTGDGWLELADEDLVDAGMVELVFNLGERGGSLRAGRIGYYTSSDKIFVIGRSRKDGRFKVLGIRDPVYVHADRDFTWL